MEMESGKTGKYKEKEFERPGPDLCLTPGKRAHVSDEDMEMDDVGPLQPPHGLAGTLPRSRSDAVQGRLRARPLSMAHYSSLSSLTTPDRKRSRFRLLRKKRKHTDELGGNDVKLGAFDPETASMASNVSGFSTMSGMSTSESVYSLRTRKRRGLEALAEAVSRSPAIKAVKRSFSHQVHPEEGTGSPYKQPKIQIKEYHSPKAQPSRPKEQRLWMDTIKNPETFSKEILRRQEAIYEIYVHATTMRDDARTVVDNYAKPMRQLGLLSDEEEVVLFGNLPAFPEIHSFVADKVADLRNPDDGTVDCVGNTLLYCFPKLRLLISFCVQLSKAKRLYNQKTSMRNFADFLERCQKSSFSAKRSLWDFMDSQRSSLIKYPLLLKGVIKTTPSDHPDAEGLRNALTCIEEILAEMDRRTGEFRCSEMLSMLDYTYDNRCPVVDQSKVLVCSGSLKLAARGQRVQVCLFDRALVIGRPTTHNGAALTYQVSQQPIYTEQLVLEDLNDGDAVSLGSFRNALQRRSAPTSGLAHAFRVSRCQQGDSTDSAHGKQRNSFTLVANDVHDKRVWTDAISKASVTARSRPASMTETLSPPSPPAVSSSRAESEVRSPSSEALSTVV